jgi:MFS family permease
MADVGFALGRTVSRGDRKSIVLFTLCLGLLVAQVDTSVVNLAIQPIGSAFGASVTALQWVLDAYNLTYATLLLTGGLIADLYGRRLAFLVGALILSVASLGCAFSPSVGFLIAARAAAGLGGALVLPASLAIVRVVFTDPVERRHALGVWASCNGLAFVIGPTLGGSALHGSAGRACFYSWFRSRSPRSRSPRSRCRNPAIRPGVILTFRARFSARLSSAGSSTPASPVMTAASRR